MAGLSTLCCDVNPRANLPEPETLEVRDHRNVASCPPPSPEWLPVSGQRQMLESQWNSDRGGQAEGSCQLRETHPGVLLTGNLSEIPQLETSFPWAGMA